MLAAFKQYGLQPGPLLFDNSSELVWALLASFFIAMVVLLNHHTTRRSHDRHRRLVFDLGGGGLDPEQESMEGVPVTFEQPDPRDHDEVGSMLDTASRHDASLIVIGIKRRSATGKLLFGSMAQKVLLEAGAPALAAKP